MQDQQTMWYAGFCRVCETGPLGLRVCGCCERVVLLCDECDAVWTSADASSPPSFSANSKLPCPHCEASLLDPPSRWATRAECEATPWIAEAVAAGELELRKGEPLG
ncbi:MAG: hypothetical protein AAF596_01815 [Planctomycetota bacterium]